MIRSLFFFIAIVLVDQVTKSFARTYHNAWSGTFFRFTENDGMVFSIHLPQYLLWTLCISTVAVLLFLCWRSIRLRRFHELSIFAMIGGGGVSNLIDRFRFGAVTDIVALPGGLLFNLADCFIVAGIFLFLWHNKSSPHRS